MATHPRRKAAPKFLALGSSDADPFVTAPLPAPAGADLPPIDIPPTTAATDDESPEPLLSPPSHLAEEERAYFWHAMDERKNATLAAEHAMNTLTAKRAAADSYRDYLWTKYALGDADSIDTETGLITRHQG